MKTGHVNADYNEPKADSTFKGFRLTIINHDTNKEVVNKFNTGNPIVDHYALMKFITETKQKIEHIICSSDVDHFYMDSNKYHERCVIFDKEYKDGQIVTWQEASKKGLNSDKLVKVCVTDEFKTWKQLKEYVVPKLPKAKKKIK